MPALRAPGQPLQPLPGRGQVGPVFLLQPRLSYVPRRTWPLQAGECSCSCRLGGCASAQHTLARAQPLPCARCCPVCLAHLACVYASQPTLLPLARCSARPRRPTRAACSATGPAGRAHCATRGTTAPPPASAARCTAGPLGDACCVLVLPVVPPRHTGAAPKPSRGTKAAFEVGWARCVGSKGVGRWLVGTPTPCRP